MTFFFKKTLALSKKVDPTLKIVKDHKHVVNIFFLFLILTVFFLFFWSRSVLVLVYGEEMNNHHQSSSGWVKRPQESYVSTTVRRYYKSDRVEEAVFEINFRGHIMYTGSDLLEDNNHTFNLIVYSVDDEHVVRIHNKLIVHMNLVSYLMVHFPFIGLMIVSSYVISKRRGKYTCCISHGHFWVKERKRTTSF
jgi:hypothetical protein